MCPLYTLDMKFKDKVVLVTGASRGIGKATALAFGKEGACVVVDYFVSEYEPEAESNAKLVVELIENMGSKAIAIEADVSSENQVKILVDKMISVFGKIDILINNAGIVFDTPTDQKTIGEWQRTLAVDLIGEYICAKQVVPYMIKNGKGIIVNMSSTSGTGVFNPESIDYDSAKAGVIAMTKNLAKENAIHNIRVNAVAPSWVNTEMNASLSPEYIASETARIYLKRFANPEEIANLFLFLASDESSYITGTTIVIDGGYE